MRKNLLALALLMLTSLWAFSQQEVRIGHNRFVPDQNVHPARKMRGKSNLEMGQPVGGKLNVLVQLSQKCTAEQRANLAKYGVDLLGYIGGGSYYATIKPGSNPSDFSGTGLSSVMPIQNHWRLSDLLSSSEIPEWAVRQGGDVEIQLYYFKNATESDVQSGLSNLEATNLELFPAFHAAIATIPQEKLELLSEEPWLKLATPVPPKSELLNYSARTLSGASVLQAPMTFGGAGRGLTGEGVRVGIWDGNVQLHPDYGNRVTRMEFEFSVASSGGHGMHVTGSILGAGTLNPRGQGMAFKAKSWNWNFNVQSNGLQVFHEMLYSHLNFNISLTQNSYGLYLRNLCPYYDALSYWNLGAGTLDYLSMKFPKLTHVFAAGNNQGACNRTYGSFTGRSKNLIYVAAVSQTGEITDFSSFGPTPDGRLASIVAAKGLQEFSTMPNASYGYMSGTSMACPVTTGHLALLTQRYGQLFPGQLPDNVLLKGIIANTADDAGRPGPDYEYGFGVLNAVNAIKVLENGWFLNDPKKQMISTTKPLNIGDAIQVPAGVKQLRIMIVWNDPPPTTDPGYGNSVLVNDLDLTAEINGTFYNPYILDPANPTAAAKPGADHRNNIEQIVISNPPAGEAKVYVTGTVHEPSEQPGAAPDSQPYVLTWFFDYGAPELYYPADGDVFAPGETVAVRTENTTRKVLYLLQESGASDFKTLATATVDNAASAHSQLITIPKDAKPGEAKFKVISSEGENTVTIHIAPTPKAPTIDKEECAFSGWKLNIEKLDGADEYQILQLNPENEEFTEIGTLASTANPFEFAIPNDKIIKGERNIFAIKAKFGTTWSRRSNAVLVEPYSTNPLTVSDLPLIESFQNIPLKYSQVKVGGALQYQTVETPAGLSPQLGSHVLVVSVKTNKAATDAEWANPFEVADHLATISVCDLDLSKVPTGTKLVLKLYTLLKADKPENTQLRLRVNGKVVPNTLGVEVNKPTLPVDDGTAYSFEGEYAWDFSQFAGTSSLMLEIQGALRNSSSSFYTLYYKLEKAVEEPDVALQFISGLKSGMNLGVQNGLVTVINRSLNPAASVPLVLTVNDEPRGGIDVKELKGGETRVVMLPVDLSTSEPEGEVMRVQVRAVLDGDIDSENDMTSTEVLNYGNVLPQPKTGFFSFFGFVFPVDPNKIEYVDGTVLYSDMGGGLSGYEPGQRSTLQLRPKHKGMGLEVKFLKWDLGSGSMLKVYNQTIESKDGSFQLIGVTPAKTIMSQSGSEQPIIQTVAENGSLTFNFSSARGEQDNFGWLAEVREIYLTNKLTLEPLMVADHYSDQMMKPVITVKNNTAEKVTGVKVKYGLEGAASHNYTIPVIEPNATLEVTLEEPVKLPFPTMGKLEVIVYGDDQVMSDNKQSISVFNDEYFRPGISESKSCLRMKKFGVGEDMRSVKLTQAEYDYAVDNENPYFTFYKDPATTFKFVTSEVTADMLPASIYVWLDVDDTKSFTDQAPGFYMIPLEAGKTEYSVDIDLTQQDFVEGSRRMRVAILKADELEKFQNGETYACGMGFDIIVKLVPEAEPKVYDMGVKTVMLVDASGDIVPRIGLNLPSDAKVKLLLHNWGNVPSGEVVLTVSDKDKELFTEDYSAGVAPGATSNEIILSKTVDLSTPGEHEISVSVHPKDPNVTDATSYNNAASYEVTSLYSNSTTELFAVSMRGADDDKIAFADMPAWALGLDQESFAIELWVSMGDQWDVTSDGSPKLASIFASQGLQIAAVARFSDVPSHSFVVGVGGRLQGIYSTPEGTVEPNKWYHLCVNLEKVDRAPSAGSYHEAEIFINGEKIATTTLGDVNKMVLADLYKPVLAQAARAKLKLLRVWNGTRTKEEFADNSTKLLDESTANLKLQLAMNEGQGNFIAGEKGYAQIRGSYADVWYNLKNDLIDQLGIKDEVENTFDPATSTYTALVLHDADLATLTPEFKPIFPGAVSYQVDASAYAVPATLDFSSVNPKAVKLSYTKLFGIDIAQTANLLVKKDLSNACELTALKAMKVDNSTMTDNEESASYDAASRTFTFTLLGTRDDTDALRTVVADLTISPDAKAYYAAQEISAPTGKLTIDLTQQAVIRVVAANGRDEQFYFVTLLRQSSPANPIKVLGGTTEFTFSNQLINLIPGTFTLASGTPQWSVENSSILVLERDPADNTEKFRTSSIGETTVRLRAAGSATNDPSSEATATITVTPASLTITPKQEDVMEGEMTASADALEFELTGQQYDEPVSAFTRPTYKLYDAAGQEVPMGQFLSAGTYTWKPVGYTTPYADGNYMVTLAEKSFQVTANADLVTLTLKVEDADGAVDGAMITVDDTYHLTSNATTPPTIKVKKNSAVKVEVSKDDYLTAIEAIQVADADLEKIVTLKKLSITVEYMVANPDEGSIAGQKLQIVANDGMTTSVTAVPALGYAFAKWNDDNTDPVRHEENVIADATYTAEFKAVEVKATYKVTFGGHLTDATLAEQTMNYGSTPKAVTVEADPGYVFLGWSDGVMESTRQDAALSDDLTVTAEFYKIYALPLVQNFDASESMPANWSSVPSSEPSMLFEVFRYDAPEGNRMPAKAKNLLGILSWGSFTDIDALAITPWISVEDIAEDITVSFDLIMIGRASKHILQAYYRFDDDNWDLTGAPAFNERMNVSTLTPQSFTIDKAELVGRKTLQVAWRFVGYSLEGAIDNVNISVENPTEYNATYAVAGNGTLISEASGNMPATSIVQVVKVGEQAKSVTATPDSGYEFTGWSDGKTDNPRTDDMEVDVVAMFDPIMPQLYQLTYSVVGEGSLQGPTLQSVPESGMATAVTAIPARGFRFLSWNDGLTTPQRIDSNPTANMSYVATFVEDGKEFTLLYQAGMHGEIIGQAIQYLSKGENAQTVYARPEPGYVFTGWSDGSVENPRTDLNVEDNLTVEAMFAQQYTLSYMAAANGSIVGAATQHVAKGENGTEVYAKADAGYVFTKWSDDKTENPRTDIDVSANVTVEAMFEVAPTTIEVTVLSSEGKPVADVKVELMMSGNTMSEKTNADGVAMISVKDAGDYSLKVSKDGYVAANATVTVAAGDEKVSKPIVLQKENTATAIASELLANVRIMPNPFVSDLRLEGVSSLHKLEVVSLDGRVVRAKIHDGAPVLELNTSDLAVGTYVLRMVDLEGKVRTILALKQQ